MRFIGAPWARLAGTRQKQRCTFRSLLLSIVVLALELTSRYILTERSRLALELQAGHLQRRPVIGAREVFIRSNDVEGADRSAVLVGASVQQVVPVRFVNSRYVVCTVEHSAVTDGGKRWL